MIDAGIVLQTGEIVPQLQSESVPPTHCVMLSVGLTPVILFSVMLHGSSSHGMQSLRNLCSITADVGLIVQFPKPLNSGLQYCVLLPTYAFIVVDP